MFLIGSSKGSPSINIRSDFLVCFFYQRQLFGNL